MQFNVQTFCTKYDDLLLPKSISGKISYECESSVSESSPLSLKLESSFSALKYNLGTMLL